MAPLKCISSIHFLAISCIYMQDFQYMFRFMTDEIPSRYPVEWQVIGWHLSDAFPLFISYQFPVHASITNNFEKLIPVIIIINGDKGINIYNIIITIMKKMNFSVYIYCI